MESWSRCFDRRRREGFRQGKAATRGLREVEQATAKGFRRNLRRRRTQGVWWRFLGFSVAKKKELHAHDLGFPVRGFYLRRRCSRKEAPLGFLGLFLLRRREAQGRRDEPEEIRRRQGSGLKFGDVRGLGIFSAENY
ncbi:hypothetical protein U1Q18_012027 [Sarracenia purpurea var. burkii]